MKPSGKKTPLALAVLALTTLAFATSASAEEVFVHFEDLAVGQDVAEPGILGPWLAIEPLNILGELSVIETFYKGPVAEYTVYKAPNVDPNPWTDWSIWNTNDSLEDRDGNIVCSHEPDYDGEVAHGFANTDCSWLGRLDPKWCPQEFLITFGGRSVYWFRMLMVDYGDWNPTRSVDHKFELRGFDGGVQIANYTIEYATDPVNAPSACSLGPGIDLKTYADACDCDGFGLGHSHLEIYAPPDSNGFDRVELWASDPGVVVPDLFCLTDLPFEPEGCLECATGGCDPNAAFDSLRLGYVNLFDVHPVSCPNPLNLRGRGLLPAAVLGTAGFDVADVDPESCTLAGVRAVRWGWEDVSRPFVAELIDEYSCTSDGPDGFMDLTLKFRSSDVAAALSPLSPGDIVHVSLQCTLTNGVDVIVSEDIMKVIG